MSTTKPASNSSPATTAAPSAPPNAKCNAAIQYPDGVRVFRPVPEGRKPRDVAHDRPQTWEYVELPNGGYLFLGTPTGNAKG